MLDFKQNHFSVALACFLLARGIFEEVQSPHRDETQKSIDSLHNTIGDEKFTALLAQVEPQIQQIVDQTIHEEPE